MDTSKTLAIASADTDAWNGGTGKYNGLPTLLRYRPNLQNHLGNPNYKKRLVITWNYETSKEANGMPTSEQLDTMKIFEDAIISELDPDRSAVLAFVYTSNGLKEWHFYVKDIQDVGLRINNALKELPKFPIQLAVENDPNWDELRNVIESVK